MLHDSYHGTNYFSSFIIILRKYKKSMIQ